MAVFKDPLDATLRLRLMTGTKDNGDPILVMRNFKDVRPEADPEDIYEIGQGLASLIKYPLYEMQLQENSSLSGD